MMTLRSRLSLALFTILLGLLLSLIDSCTAWKAFGKVVCNGHPLSHVNVKLVAPYKSYGKILGSTRSRTRGNFVINGKSHVRHRWVYLVVDLEYDGYFGKMALENQNGSIRRLSTFPRRSSNIMNYDDTNFNNPVCQTFLQFYLAIGEFSRRTKGMPLPFSELEVRTSTQTLEDIAPNVIVLSKNKGETFQSARQYLGRALLYGYNMRLWAKKRLVSWRRTQTPVNCSEKLDKWLAFREGWANFWAGKCKGLYGSSPLDFAYPGNVAKSLRNLQKKCRTSWKNMLEILRGNGMKELIENFRQYDLSHYQLHHCRLLWVYKM